MVGSTGKTTCIVFCIIVVSEEGDSCACPWQNFIYAFSGTSFELDLSSFVWLSFLPACFLSYLDWNFKASAVSAFATESCCFKIKLWLSVFDIRQHPIHSVLYSGLQCKIMSWKNLWWIFLITYHLFMQWVEWSFIFYFTEWNNFSTLTYTTVPPKHLPRAEDLPSVLGKCFRSKQLIQ